MWLFWRKEDARRLAVMAADQDNVSNRPSLSTRGIQLTYAEAEAILEAHETEEEREKTLMRRLVETHLQHYKWYFPRKDIPDAPSLQKAWAYFEHITLPRYFADENLGSQVKRRAQPGEEGETELYPPIKTSQANLIEFGVGVDLYFQTCALVCIMFFLAALLNITNIYYFSANYSGEKHRAWALQGSAVCTETYWAVCANCNNYTDQVELEEVADRYAIASNGDILVKRNNCEIRFDQGVVNWITWLFFFLFLLGMSLYLRAREIRFDEDKLTPNDYSVVVKNPPPDVLDPDEWRNYFSQFAEKQVTLISIHLNNEAMLKKLVQRRQVNDNLRRMLPKGTDMEDENALRGAVDSHIRERNEEPRGCFGRFLECTVFWPLKKIGLLFDAETLLKKADFLTEEIKELQKRRYEVSKVYATFETEDGQHAALAALSTSRLNVLLNNTEKAPPSALFHDRVITIKEAAEPNAVRWTDLSATKLYRIISFSMTLGLTIALISLAAFLENVTRQNPKLGPRYSGVLVSIFNGIVPEFVRALMIFERHQTEGNYQTSLYLKITIFRWVNTAIAILYITPFTSTLGDRPTDLLPAISSILWAETFITPALRLLDLPGNFERHILAPRAMTQEEMDLKFLGTPYNLGERYTDLTKVLFVCFFYSALFPASFFFGFAILFVQYHVDKFCLLRIWGSSPTLGNSLAVYSRRYFFSGATLAFIIASAYAWAQFPYDNVCDLANSTAPTLTEVQYHNVTLLKDWLEANANGAEPKPSPDPIIVGQKEQVYFCAQGFREQSEFAFPPKVEDQPDGLKWMTKEQEELVELYYWSVIFALVVFLVGSFLTTTVNAVRKWLSSGFYKPAGVSQKIDFSCLLDNKAYVPHVKLRNYPFPLLAANVDDLDERLLGFADPDHSVDDHNMIFDVPGYPAMHRCRRKCSSSQHSGIPLTDDNSATGNFRPIFGTVKHYPPSWWARQLDPQEPSDDE